MQTIIGLSAAAKIAGVSRPTMLSWCRKFPNLAVQPARAYHIDPAELFRIIEARKVMKP